MTDPISDESADFASTSLAEAALLATEHEVAALQERIAELEFATEDAGWERIDDSGTSIDPSAQHLRRVIRDAQTMYLANPLINHAVDTIAVYVFGQGVNIAGVGAANDRVQTFIADPRNAKVLFGQVALLGHDRALTYEGNRYFALFSKPGTITKVRTIPTHQMVAGDIIRNPEDDAEVWFYMRRWTRQTRDRSGRVTPEERVDYYPSVEWARDATERPGRYGDGPDEGEVHWDSPVVHVKDGGLTGAKYGFPTIYPALAWARAVSRDLSDYATVKRALARFAWKVVTKTRGQARSVRDRLNTEVTMDNPRETNPAPATGSAFVAVEGADITPLTTRGAAPNPEEGRRLGLLVAAGVGIPETILFGNADAGNLATARTLDRPTELMMKARQSVWTDALTDIVAYDLRRAADEGTIPRQEPDPDAEAPAIPGVADPAGLTDPDPVLDPTAGVVQDAPVMRDVELTPDVTFVDILEDDIVARVGAIVTAATLEGRTEAGIMPHDLLVRLLLEALGVEDIDEVLDDLHAEQEADAAADAVNPLMGGMPGDPTGDIAPPAAFAEAIDAFTATLVAGTGPRRRGARATRPVRRVGTGRATPAPANA
jgi:hypothetical protein